MSAGEGGWITRFGNPTEVIPLNDVVEHCEGGDCVCGPAAEVFPGPGGDRWLLVHHSADGRESRESR